MPCIVHKLLSAILIVALSLTPLPVLANDLAANTVSLSQASLKDLRLTDHEGRPFSLSELPGKVVVLSFMFAGCSPVQTAALRRVYQDLRLDRGDKGILFLSVSVATQTDTPEQLKAFGERFGISFANWRFAVPEQATLDTMLKTFDAGMPPEAGELGHLNTVFLVNSAGELSKRYQGYPVNPAEIQADLLKMAISPDNQGIK